MKRCCDTCDHFSVSPAGTIEGCWLNLSNPEYISDDYWDERRKANKGKCKGFVKIRTSPKKGGSK